MRKAVVISTCIMCLICILSGCGNADSAPKETTTPIEVEVSTETNIIDSDEKNDVAKRTNVVESDMSWRQFLKDYEAWVETYVEFTEKYKVNPTDMSLISDYSKFVQQTAEWAEEAEKYQGDLENASPEILGEYVETLGRITKRIIKIAY